MSVINRIVLKTDTNGVSPKGLSNSDGPLMLRQCSDLIGRAAQGGCSANLSIASAPVAAQATVTATGDGTNADTLTIANVVITIVTSGATGNQVNIGSSVTNLAHQIVALINGSGSDWQGICSASNVAGVITLTAALPGAIGNGLGLAKSSTALTLTHLWGASVAGSEGVAKVFSVGL